MMGSPDPDEPDGHEPAVPSLTNDSVDARAAGQLRSLMTISTAVGASHRFEELLELIADEA
ncbi:MAG TPA: hypothetical protein VML96_11215, partial [Egibacteraceae bacterium]|nr:hypothetical protein [Egibacteraceae bacterium]